MTILQGDARTVLPTLDSGSVQCVVTSPPYWGLRNYGVGGQIGLESTPDAYVQTLVAVFSEVRRVLRDDATVWLNLGDCYFGGGYANHAVNGPEWLEAHGGDQRRNRQQNRINANPMLKPKDLVGIPWRVAFALQADGWYLRSDIIWAKGLSFCPSYAGSVMPESVTDRPTRGHEYLFLLTKSARYYYDAEAVREKWADGRNGAGGGHQMQRNERMTSSTRRPQDAPTTSGRNLRSVWAINPQPLAGVVSRGSYRIALPGCPVHDRPGALVSALECGELQVVSGPARSLGIGESPESAQEGVAYAMSEDRCGSLSDATAARVHSNETRRMAAALVRRGTGGDTSSSGTAYTPTPRPSDTVAPSIDGSSSAVGVVEDETVRDPWAQTAPHILGIATFEPRSFSCTCEFTGKCEKRKDHYASFPMALVEPCIKAGSKKGDLVLDPFAGSGTVGCVALKLGREFLGIELNAEYCEMARDSIDGPLFASSTA